MDELIKIGEFSKINHVSIPTLRLYDELGILKLMKVQIIVIIRLIKMLV